MKNQKNASLRGFAAAFAAIVCVCVLSVFSSCEKMNAGEEIEITPSAAGTVAVLANDMLVNNNRNLAFVGLKQQLNYIAMPAAQQGKPALTSQSNPENVTSTRTETRFGYADGQVITSFVEGIGGQQVSASFMPKSVEANVVNDHMTKITASFDVTGFWVCQEYADPITVPFNGIISKEWIQADETVETDTIVEVQKIIQNNTDTLIQYVVQVEYKVDTLWQDSIVYKDRIIYQDRVIHDSIPVYIPEYITVTVRDTMVERVTEEVIKFVDKYRNRYINQHSYLGGAWAVLELDGERLLEFNLGLTYQVVEVEKNAWGKNALTNKTEKQFFFDDSEIATWSVVTNGAKVESVKYVNTSFTNTEVGDYKLGKTSFIVNGTYTGIDGKEESFEFELNPYYLQSVKPEAVVKVDVYTYTFEEETVASSNASQWMKNFTVTRYLNGSVDRTWSYKAWVAKVGPITGTHLHVSDAKVLSENLTNGTSSNRWNEECGEKQLTGKNLGFIANTDCRLYDYEVAFPSTAGGKVEAKSQIAYWVKTISFVDPERPDDENGRHTWTMGEQATIVTAHAIKSDSAAEKTFTFSEGASQVTASYEGSYILSLDHQIGGKSWYSQTAATHLYK